MPNVIRLLLPSATFIVLGIVIFIIVCGKPHVLFIKIPIGSVKFDGSPLLQNGATFIKSPISNGSMTMQPEAITLSIDTHRGFSIAKNGKINGKLSRQALSNI